MKHIWKKSPAAHLLFACLLSIALLPGCIQDPYELQQGLDRISFGATTAAPDGGASTKGGDGLSLRADGWFVALGAEEGSDVAWQPEPQTKTSYSGYDEDGNLISNTAGTAGTNTTSAYERIDWVTGDSVTVISSQAYVRDRSTTPPGTVQSHGTYSRMNYGVADLGAPSGQNHSARLSPADGEGLLWDNNNSTHYFLAVYPATAEDKFYPASAYYANFSLEIPDTQHPKRQRTLNENGREVLEFLPDMDMVYMYAGTNGSRSNGSNVALNFKPMVSAARFTIRAADVGGGVLKLQEAILETTYANAYFALAGKMSCQVTYQGGLSNISYTETKQRVSIPLDDVQLGDRDIRLTFITLRSYHYYLKLTLKFEGGVTRSLELKRGGNDINWPEDSKLYFDLAGISYMPSYDLPDAIWGWTQDVLPAPVPQNVVDGDGNAATPTVSYRFKDDGSSTDIATVSGDQITCGTAAGKRTLVVSVTVGPVTAETEIPVYVQKLARVEIDEPAEGHNVRVGANYALPYTVYWQRPNEDGTVEELASDDAAAIYNATVTDLAGFYPEASVPAASQTYLALGTEPGTVKGLLAVAQPGVDVSLSITDGSHTTKPTHIVTDETKVFVTDPPFESAEIGYKIPTSNWSNSIPAIWVCDGEVGRIFTVRAVYDDGSADIYDYTDVTWSTNDAGITIDSDGYVTIPTLQSTTVITAEFIDRYGATRTISRAISVADMSLSMRKSDERQSGSGASAVFTVSVSYPFYPLYFIRQHWTSYSYTLSVSPSGYTDSYGVTYATHQYYNWDQAHPGEAHVFFFYYYSDTNPPVLPANYSFRGATVSWSCTRIHVPYAEVGYQNTSGNNTRSCSASLYWTSGPRP